MSKGKFELTDKGSIPESSWVALCLITESNQAQEWLYIFWAIRNRVGQRRFASNYRDVVLQPFQFSHFNAFLGFRGNEEKLFDLIMEGESVNGPKLKPLSSNLLSTAERASEEFMIDGVWRRPFSLSVCHYWSPISMVPRNSKPSWHKSAKRTFTPSCIDPERFIFAEGVP